MYLKAKATSKHAQWGRRATQQDLHHHELSFLFPLLRRRYCCCLRCSRGSSTRQIYTLSQIYKIGTKFMLIIKEIIASNFQLSETTHIRSDEHVLNMKKEDWQKLWDEQISEETTILGKDIWKCKQVLSHKQEDNCTLLLCKWDDICYSQTWVPLNSMILHQIKPVLVYAIKHDLLKDKPFRKLKEAIEFDVVKRYKTIMQVKAQQQQGPKHKFGVEVPRSLAHALALDKANRNNLCMDAAKKERMQLLDYKTL